MLNAPDRDRNDCDRRHGRVRLEETSVSIGRVLDLSRSGLRVRTAKPIKPNSPPINVGFTFDDEQITVQCKVAWIEKDGLFKRQVGLEFQGLDDHQAKLLAELARSAGSNSAIQHEILNRAG